MLDFHALLKSRRATGHCFNVGTGGQQVSLELPVRGQARPGHGPLVGRGTRPVPAMQMLPPRRRAGFVKTAASALLIPLISSGHYPKTCLDAPAMITARALPRCELVLRLGLRCTAATKHHGTTIPSGPFYRQRLLRREVQLRRWTSCTTEVGQEPATASQTLGKKDDVPTVEEAPARHKHLCLYFTQGLCTLAEDSTHISKFTHLYPDLSVKAEDLLTVGPQPFDYFLVMDLEGKVEILEFPVVLLDSHSLVPVDRFHRFVRPAKMSDKRIEQYIEGKYGRWGLDRVWHDTAVPFTQVIQDFERWLESHGLWDAAQPGKMVKAAFVTCGNWDVKTKIPEQCVCSQMPLPPYFNEWINLKDIYLNHYKQRAGGMLAMLRGLNMPLTGSHHLGLDDAHNIARVLQRILCDGAVGKITARRKAADPKTVTFTFANRVM